MRVSKEEKVANRTRIVEMAEGLFKTDGIEATGVATVMQAAGLTHGGFYRHFPSKDDLVHAVIQKSFDDMADRLEALIAQKGAKAALADLAQTYLSWEHVDNPGDGCPIAALGIEAGRGPVKYQTVMTEGKNRITNLLAKGFDGSQIEKHQRATALLATMIGAVILARFSSSQSEAEAVLSNTRTAILATL